MDELGNGEATHDREDNDSERYSERCLTAYLAINAVFYTLVGAYIGWRAGIIWGIVGAVIGIVFSFFVTGTSWDHILAKNLPELIEGLGLSLGMLFGLVLIVPSLHGLIDHFGYGHLLSNYCIWMPLLAVGGMFGTAVGVFVGGFLAKILKQIQKVRI